MNSGSHCMYISLPAILRSTQSTSRLLLLIVQYRSYGTSNRWCRVDKKKVSLCWLSWKRVICSNSSSQPTSSLSLSNYRQSTCKQPQKGTFEQNEWFRSPLKNLLLQVGLLVCVGWIEDLVFFFLDGCQLQYFNDVGHFVLDYRH